MERSLTLRDRVASCIETVEAADAWSFFDTFWYAERVKVTVGVDDPAASDRGLSCRVEVVDPAFFVDPDWLVPGEARLAGTHPYLAEVADELTAAISSVTGEAPVEPFVYCGVEPGTVASSALFEARVRTPS